MQVAIEGYRGRVGPVQALLAALGNLPDGTEVQLLRADRVYGRDHLASAVLRADRALASGRSVASSWPLEVLRYAAGERQIGRALAFLGLVPESQAIAAVVRGDPAPFRKLAEALGWTRDDAVLSGGDDVLDAWGFTAAERGAIPAGRRGDLVLERVALADVAK